MTAVSLFFLFSFACFDLLRLFWHLNYHRYLAADGKDNAAPKGRIVGKRGAGRDFIIMCIFMSIHTYTIAGNNSNSNNYKTEREQNKYSNKVPKNEKEEGTQRVAANERACE